MTFGLERVDLINARFAVPPSMEVSVNAYENLPLERTKGKIGSAPQTVLWCVRGEGLESSLSGHSC